jgi:hypothetical protein
MRKKFKKDELKVFQKSLGATEFYEKIGPKNYSRLFGVIYFKN